MKIANYITVLMMLAVGTANATEQVADKTVVHKKVHAHKKCVEKNGKPCHLHKDAASAVPAASAVSATTAAATAAVVAPVVAPLAAVEKKLEVVKADAALSDADGRKLAAKSGCFVCHSVEKKVVGPAWHDVAGKYRGDANAEAMLVAKVSKGGKGVWGSTPMPANAPRVNEADIKALVKFVLSLK
jgi:cytochrome c